MLRVPSDFLKIIHKEQCPRRQDGPDVPGEDEHHYSVMMQSSPHCFTHCSCFNYSFSLVLESNSHFSFYYVQSR